MVYGYGLHERLVHTSVQCVQEKYAHYKSHITQRRLQVAERFSLPWKATPENERSQVTSHPHTGQESLDQSHHLTNPDHAGFQDRSAVAHIKNKAADGS